MAEQNVDRTRDIIRNTSVERPSIEMFPPPGSRPMSPTSPSEVLSRIGSPTMSPSSSTYSLESTATEDALLDAGRAAHASIIEHNRIFPGTRWNFHLSTSATFVKRMVLWIFIGVSAIGIGLLFADGFLLDASVWKGRFSKTLSDPRHCEPVRHGRFMFQRLNSLTTLSYIFVGAVLIGFGYDDGLNGGSESWIPPNVIALCPLMSIAIGASCVAVGYTSFLYHASYSERAAELDVASIYVLLSTLDGVVFLRFFLCTHQEIHKLRFQANICCMVFVALGTYLFAARTSTTIEFVMDVDQVVLIVAMIAWFALGLATWPQVTKSWAYGFLALFLMGSAAGFWAMDKFGHPAWHLFNSAALFSAYLCLRSEHMPMGIRSGLTTPSIDFRRENRGAQENGIQRQ